MKRFPKNLTRVVILTILLFAMFFTGCGVGTAEKIHIVENNTSEAGPGPLTKENATIGGIHLGDSREQVLQLYGEPDSKSTFRATSFPLWYYKNLNMYVAFYTKDEPSDPVDGVIFIDVLAPSSPRTDKGIGIGDSAEAIIKKYTRVNEFRPNEAINTGAIFINGSNHFSIKSIPGVLVNFITLF